MNWRKLGSFFNVTGQYPWMVTHAANPTAQVLDGTRVRIYFGTRDRLNRAHVASAVFERSNGLKLIDLSPTPLVEPGPPGTFDDSGASMGCLAVDGAKVYLYYLGWNLGVTVPWRNSIGLAISSDGGLSFAKASMAPLLDRCAADPYSISYPWVLRDGALWRMWYGSNLRWGKDQGDMDHVLKYAESGDGINWRREGRIAIGLEGSAEFALARPCVVKDGGTYRMWFTHRGEKYRIGYAESADALQWRRNAAGPVPDVSQAGWDSEMVTYPFVFDWAGSRYMLYNGNGYGRTGIGIAIAE